jgi:hypothetical protein
MNTRGWVAGLVVLAGGITVAGAAAASDTTVQLSPRLGLGTLHVGKQYTLSGKEENLDSVGLGIQLGVVTPIGLMFEGGIQGHSNFSYFGADDRYELTYQDIMVGYQFETPHGFRIVPKAGRMRWKLYDKEGRLFHPGPEAENTKVGYENFWEVTLQKRVGRSAALGVSFRDNNFEFGSAQAIMFTATFDL